MTATGNCVECDLSALRMPGADLRGADVTGANLALAMLVDSDPRGARLGNADLRKANLREDVKGPEKR